jgi:hypothetical protein
MARKDACELAWRLGRQAEAVCRHYLSNGRRHGAYWQVGDISNNPGRSMFVRLRDSAKGRAGKYFDAATGDHGDLLDVIREVRGLNDFFDVAKEARHFLSLPHPEPRKNFPLRGHVPSGSAEAARRLWAISKPIPGTIAEIYLRRRAIAHCRDLTNLRFHPRCFYRPDESSAPDSWPAMIAAVTDHCGKITGVHRTWLARDGSGKAPIATQRKAMGDLLGNAVRFGPPAEIMAVGEGVETMLSLRTVLPKMTVAAALSAAHLAAFLFPPSLRRLYIARDNDAAGDAARDRLIERANKAEIDAIVLSPRLGDFNEDLTGFGTEALGADIRLQLAPEDAALFMRLTV